VPFVIERDAEVMSRRRRAPSQPRKADSIDMSLPTVAEVNLIIIPRLESERNRAPCLLATQTAGLASAFIYASALEALPIGI
jgi:hypothetical protein